jgi:hypothetical protein
MKNEKKKKEIAAALQHNFLPFLLYSFSLMKI